MQNDQIKPTLSTIGYEGRTSEAYFCALVGAGITVLCDVRRNPISRKPGFSRTALSHRCEELGIQYVHIPTLGIESEKRKTLKTQDDYDALFAEYEKTLLPHHRDDLERIQKLVDAGERVALTCFERKPSQCHRHCVTDALRRLSCQRIKVKSL